MTEPDGPTWMDVGAARRVGDELRRAFPDDTPMPEDVASRLHARLAVETAAPTEEVAAPVTTLPLGARRRIPPQWFAAAAVIVAIGITTAVVLDHQGSKTSPDSSSSSAPAANAAAPNQSKAARLPTSHVTHSNAVITTTAELDAHTKDLVSGAGQVSADNTASAQPQQQLEKTVVGGLTACLASLDDSKIPLAVDAVSYEGQDSLLVLFPGEAVKEVDVFVIGPQCNSTPPDGIRIFRTVRVG